MIERRRFDEVEHCLVTPVNLGVSFNHLVLALSSNGNKSRRFPEVKNHDF